jgi:hypothetical protein
MSQPRFEVPFPKQSEALISSISCISSSSSSSSSRKTKGVSVQSMKASGERIYAV